MDDIYVSLSVFFAPSVRDVIRIPEEWSTVIPVCAVYSEWIDTF